MDKNITSQRYNMDDDKFEKLVFMLVNATIWLADCSDLTGIIYDKAERDFKNAKTGLLSEIKNLQRIIYELENVSEKEKEEE